MNNSFFSLKVSVSTSPSRTFSGISAFLMAVVLTAGLAAAPRTLAAQEASAPAAQAPAAQTAAAPEAKKSQEEQNKAFLLEGPMVKWAARTFSLSQETASNIFQFINFGIIVLLVGIPVVKVLPKVFHKRTETLSQSLKEARAATADAKARLSAVEAKLAGLDDEIKKFRTQVEQESLDDEKRIKASLAEESARIVEAAEQELDVAAAQARRSLRLFAAELAVEQAAKQLVLTPETDRALIADFIGGVAATGAKGGQN